MRSLKGLIERGQSPWYDNLSKELIQSGGLGDLVDKGIVGVTSNPTIFDQAISNSSSYDESLKACKAKNLDAQQTYWDLVCADISAAADILKPTYDATSGLDGYVSVEVSPMLANNAVETIAQANELYGRISRDNVMIKIPATIEGLTAIEAVIANSIPVNVTLIFSNERYEQVINAFKLGASKAEKVPASVASFFVSRLDTKVDFALGQDSELLGKAAIANASIAYSTFKDNFSSIGTEQDLQRPLWASTSTKNPDYSPTLYVDELIARNTVNTLPGITIDAILSQDGQYPKNDLEDNADLHLANWNQITQIVPMEAIMKELEEEGVSSFEKSYTSCIESISSRLAEM